MTDLAKIKSFTDPEEALEFFDCNPLHLWGTYGKKAYTYPVTHWVRLADCSTAHLENILLTQCQVEQEQRLHILHILIARKNGLIKKRRLMEAMAPLNSENGLW
tara:strand:+ start:5494 stop:5805 length:312 start_codon:yes stop_codon:yes gene_type:complete